MYTQEHNQIKFTGKFHKNNYNDFKKKLLNESGLKKRQKNAIDNNIR